MSTWHIHGWLLEFHLLATSKVIAGQVPTCDSAHSWQLYCTAPVGYYATNIMTLYTSPSHYSDTEPTSPGSFLIMPSVWLGSDTYQLLSH